MTITSSLYKSHKSTRCHAMRLLPPLPLASPLLRGSTWQDQILSHLRLGQTGRRPAEKWQESNPRLQSGAWGTQWNASLCRNDKARHKNAYKVPPSLPSSQPSFPPYFLPSLRPFSLSSPSSPLSSYILTSPQDYGTTSRHDISSVSLPPFLPSSLPPPFLPPVGSGLRPLPSSSALRSGFFMAATSRIVVVLLVAFVEKSIYRVVSVPCRPPFLSPLKLGSATASVIFLIR